jgi:hypothetical protein
MVAGLEQDHQYGHYRIKIVEAASYVTGPFALSSWRTWARR